MSSYPKQLNSFSYIVEVEKVKEINSFITCSKHNSSNGQYLVKIMASNVCESSFTQECTTCYFERGAKQSNLIFTNFDTLMELTIQEAFINSIDQGLKTKHNLKQIQKQDELNNIQIRMLQFAFEVINRFEEKAYQGQQCKGLRRLNIKETEIEQEAIDPNECEQLSMKLSQARSIIQKVGSFIKRNEELFLTRQKKNQKNTQSKLKQSDLMIQFEMAILKQLNSIEINQDQIQSIHNQGFFDEVVEKMLKLPINVKQKSMFSFHIEILRDNLKQIFQLIVLIRKEEAENKLKGFNFQLGIINVKDLVGLIQLWEIMHRKERQLDEKEKNQVRLVCSQETEEHSIFQQIQSLEGNLQRLRNGKFILIAEESVELLFDFQSLNDLEVPVNIWDKMTEISLTANESNQYRLRLLNIIELIELCSNLKSFSLDDHFFIQSDCVKQFKIFLEVILSRQSMIYLDIDLRKFAMSSLKQGSTLQMENNFFQLSQNETNRKGKMCSELRTLKFKLENCYLNYLDGVEMMIAEFISRHNKLIELEFSPGWKILNIERLALGLIKCQAIEIVCLGRSNFQEKNNVIAKWIEKMIESCSQLKSFQINKPDFDIEWKQNEKCFNERKSRSMRMLQLKGNTLYNCKQLRRFWQDNYNYIQDSQQKLIDCPLLTDLRISVGKENGFYSQPIIMKNGNWILKQIELCHSLTDLHISVFVDGSQNWWRKIQDSISDCRNLVNLYLKISEWCEGVNLKSVCDGSKKINVTQLKSLEIKFYFEAISDDIIWVSRMIQSNAHGLERLKIKIPQYQNPDSIVLNRKLIKSMFNQISKCQHIEFLGLQISFSDDIQFTQLMGLFGDLLKKLVNLSQLDFRFPDCPSSITKEDIRAVEAAISKCPTLTSLFIVQSDLRYQEDLEKLSSIICLKLPRLVQIGRRYESIGM